jgi:hypothetical protein
MYTPPNSWSFAIFLRSEGRNQSPASHATNDSFARALSTWKGTRPSGRICWPEASRARTWWEPQKAHLAVCSPAATSTDAPQSLHETLVVGAPRPRVAIAMPCSIGISRCAESPGARWMDCAWPQ